MKIRPASRHIFAIGRDLINDKRSAIIELVKNSYDADADFVKIKFSSSKEKSSSEYDNEIRIEILDNGHGMSSDVITDKWMVPSTDDKLTRKTSPKGRLMQGRKGLGRYAAAILGDCLELETISNKKKSRIIIDWKDFKKFEYLDELNFISQEETTSEDNGTKLIIMGENNYLFDWTEEAINQLLKDLRKLINPFQEKEDFKIHLEFGEFYLKKFKNEKYEIEPIPVLETPLYNLKGNIREVNIQDFIKDNKDIPSFTLKLLNLKLKQNINKIIIFKGIYENLWSKKTSSEKIYKIIDFDIEKHLYCGKIGLDFRVFDREPEAIEKVIEKGLNDNLEGQKYTVPEVKKIISQFSGIGIFRGDFRIRPYGEEDNDWLGLDKRRVDDPSRKIGSKQIIGFVNILPEEESYLEENSARNGLKENNHFTFLKDSLKCVLGEFESLRYDYRERTGKSRTEKSTEDVIQKALSLSKTFNKLSGKLKQLNIEENKAKSIEKVFQEEEKKREKEIDELRKIIAKYQGQVTLGKILSLVLHEGRRPLSYIKNQIPLMDKSIKETAFKDDDIILKLDLEGLYNNGNLLINLFNKIDPLSVKKRGKMKDFSLSEVINHTNRIFQNSIDKLKIKIEKKIENDKLFGWKEDFFMIFANLLDNSIYWFEKYPIESSKIIISSIIENGRIIISYVDNGIGIEEEAIRQEKIFEPGYSTKPEGTGLGLPIVGEAASRNGYEIKAEYQENGASFILTKVK